jgi:Zn-finger nucleic acid-binding protein
MRLEIQCPKGCRELKYKSEMTRQSVALLLIGVFCLLFSIRFFFLRPFGEVMLEVLYPLGGGSVCIFIALRLEKLTRLKCEKCLGVMVESKQIDMLLKDNANYVREKLKTSVNNSEYNCPDCEEKMRKFDLRMSDPGVDLIAVIRPHKIKEIDGCFGCDLIWLDSGEEGLIQGWNIVQR